MGETPKVPVNVPARRRRAHALRATGSTRHLTGSAAGWRFQIRVPVSLVRADSSFATPSPIIRATLGPRSIRGAKRVAQRLATLCRAIFAMAETNRGKLTMNEANINSEEAVLVGEVVTACQTAIARALAAPSEAIGLARGLDTALTTLRLVETETSKGTAGAAYIVSNAETLTRDALSEVLRHSNDPARAQSALDQVVTVAPTASDVDAATSIARSVVSTIERRGGVMPTFGEVSKAYIDMRIAADGGEHPDLKYLRLRRQTFIDLMGDRPVTEYFPSDLQTYVNKMQFWPANVTKRGPSQGMNTLAILEANQGLKQKPLARKTLQDGYVANVRTMMRAGMADYKYHDPLAGVKIHWPKVLKGATPREGIGLDLLNKIFSEGVATGRLVEAILPLLSVLTGRRLGLLLYLRGSDFREKHGITVAQTSGIVFDDGHWRRVPIKTDDSATYFVMHDFLTEVGFIAWARAQRGWLFPAAHEHSDPSKWASKALNRHMRRCGAIGGNAEVFHSFRGDAISRLRDNKMQGRTARLQAGHELGDVHDRYGFRALSASECKRLAHVPLPKAIDWTVFQGLDFDALAAKRGGSGHRAKRSK
jgi:integrase